MTFVELREALLRIATVNPPTPEREPAHVHPVQESGADVTSGSLVFEVGGVERRLGPDESIQIPANTPHRFWNDEEEEDAHSIQWFRPALDIASFFETFAVLAQQNKIDSRGMPTPMQLAVMVTEFSQELRPVSPPWPVVRAMGAILGPIARRRGYRARLSMSQDAAPQG